MKKLKNMNMKMKNMKKLKKKKFFGGGGLAESATLYAKKMHFDFFFDFVLRGRLRLGMG